MYRGAHSLCLITLMADKCFNSALSGLYLPLSFIIFHPSRHPDTPFLPVALLLCARHLHSLPSSCVRLVARVRASRPLAFEQSIFAAPAAETGLGHRIRLSQCRASQAVPEAHDAQGGHKFCRHLTERRDMDDSPAWCVLVYSANAVSCLRSSMGALVRVLGNACSACMCQHVCASPCWHLHASM